MSEIDALKRRLQRERMARKEAESLLETKSRELWEAYREAARANAVSQTLQKENARLGAEVEVTRQLQQMVLPQEDDLDAINDLDIATYMSPANEVGGDYYDILRYAGGIKIGIGDVTDHGLESGVVMLMAQTAIRTLLNSGEHDPIRFLDIINRTIYENIQRMRTDRTLTLAIIDYRRTEARSGHLQISGQHEEIIMVRNGGQLEIVDTSDLGFPIGLDDDISHLFKATTFELVPGDGIILFTDGVTEAENPQKEMFGMDRLCRAAHRHWSAPAQAVKNGIVQDLRTFIGTQEIFDDITLMVIKQK